MALSPSAKRILDNKFGKDRNADIEPPKLWHQLVFVGIVLSLLFGLSYCAAHEITKDWPGQQVQEK